LIATHSQSQSGIATNHSSTFDRLMDEPERGCIETLLRAMRADLDDGSSPTCLSSLVRLVCLSGKVWRDDAAMQYGCV